MIEAGEWQIKQQIEINQYETINWDDINDSHSVSAGNSTNSKERETTSQAKKKNNSEMEQNGRPQLSGENDFTFSMSLGGGVLTLDTVDISLLIPGPLESLSWLGIDWGEKVGWEEAIHGEREIDEEMCERK